MSLLNPSSLQYTALNQGSRLAVAAGSSYILAKGWKMLIKKEPPFNPATPGVLWTEALLWGAMTGMVAGLLGTVTRRLIAEWWRDNRGLKPEDPAF